MVLYLCLYPEKITSDCLRKQRGFLDILSGDSFSRSEVQENLEQGEFDF